MCNRFCYVQEASFGVDAAACRGIRDVKAAGESGVVPSGTPLACPDANGEMNQVGNVTGGFRNSVLPVFNGQRGCRRPKVASEPGLSRKLPGWCRARHPGSLPAREKLESRSLNGHKERK